MKLRNLFTIIVMAMLFVAQKATAQWNSEASKNTQTVTASLSGSDRPDIAASTIDGSYFVRWVQYDPKGKYNFAMYVQKVDKKGNRMWGGSGIRIDTLMGNGRYRDAMVVDKKGNLLVATQNTRLDQYKQFPLVYKIDGKTGQTLWTAKIDTVAGENDYQGLAPTLAVTNSNDVIVSWNLSISLGGGSRDGVYMQKLNEATGKFMWPSRITIQDDLSMMGLFPQPIIISDASFIVTWEHRPTGSSGSTPFNLSAQKYRIDSGLAVWPTPTELSPANPVAPGAPSKYYNDRKGGVIVSYIKTGLSGAEIYAQRIDTATGQTKWGAESKLVARNTVGASSNDAGTAYDTVTNKLWFAVMDDVPNGGVHGDWIYLQGLDLNGKFIYGDSSTGPQILPLSDGTPKKSRQTIGMRNTGDGLVLVYAEGINPSKTLIKATKIDYAAKMTWTGLGDSIVTVSSVPDLNAGTLSDYIPVDSQLVIAMNTDAGVQLVQNVKNSKATGGSLGNGTIKQITAFDTATLVITYGDAVPFLGGTSNTGISPEYIVDNPDVAFVDENNNIVVLTAGTFHAQAYFPGTEVYVSKTSLPKTIIVKKKQLTVIAENKSTEYGHDIPQLTMTFHDFVNGDDVMSFTKLPTIVTPAVTKSPIGIYPITLQGGVSPKYEPVLVNGTMTIYPSSGSDKDKLEAYCSSSSTLQVNIYSTQQQTGVLQLIDMSGKMLWSQQVEVPNSITNFQIPVYTLSPAIYVVRFVGKGTVLDQKVKIK
ncbi:MBG domain-containing protein [Pinibacter aurantiacus]|uniref:MBG domain-containing protein n=1 Tax=Pinibacter aurantiacus TaxID=2851599 RepID=A0A9E2W6N9_9BACT|nr:MBG domain-containing protein [Pinibacter aurantiacus]MBV4360048.1 hypothetical protein [Pinibacter aurantiacus]